MTSKADKKIESTMVAATTTTAPHTTARSPSGESDLNNSSTTEPRERALSITDRTDRRGSDASTSLDDSTKSKALTFQYDHGYQPYERNAVLDYYWGAI